MPPKTASEKRVGKRAPRLTDVQTERRMLDAARARVERDGLSVSFDSLGYEELIVDAGVARSAAYRKWPSRDLYYDDLMRALAALPHPYMARIRPIFETCCAEVFEHGHALLRTESGRHEMVIELLRRVSIAFMVASQQGVTWTNFRALQIARKTLQAQDDLKRDITESMRSSLLDMESRMGQALSAVLELTGYQIRSDFSYFTQEHMSSVLPELIHGMLDHCIAYPRPLAERFTMDPFSTGRVEQWSLSTLGCVNALSLYLEPNSAVAGEWTQSAIDARVAECRTRLEALGDAPQE